jgi:hypothetical protein
MTLAAARRPSGEGLVAVMEWGFVYTRFGCGAVNSVGRSGVATDENRFSPDRVSDAWERTTANLTRRTLVRLGIAVVSGGDPADRTA